MGCAYKFRPPARPHFSVQNITLINMALCILFIRYDYSTSRIDVFDKMLLGCFENGFLLFSFACWCFHTLLIFM